MIGKANTNTSSTGKATAHVARKIQDRGKYHQRAVSPGYGCNAETDGDELKFEADSDAIIVKGLVSMLVKVLSGHKAEEIAKADLYFMDRIGLHQHLAQTRSNGLASMVKQMKTVRAGVSKFQPVMRDEV